MNNKIYGVGLGVGDPEMITLKALRVMRESDVLVLPTGGKDESHAYRIAVAACPELAEKETLSFEFPMTRDRQTLEARRDEIYARVKEEQLAGKNIAFLVIAHIEQLQPALIPGVMEFLQAFQQDFALFGCR